MAESPVSIPIDPLSRDVDVTVLISRPQYETGTDLSQMCFATPNVSFPPNNNRVRNYMTFDSLCKDTGWTTTDTGYWAAKAFFDQSVRPDRFAVGRIFESKVPAQIMAGTITNYAVFSEMGEGAFSIQLTTTEGETETVEVTGIDLQAKATKLAVANAISAALTAMGEDAKGLTCELDYGGNVTISAQEGYVSIGYAGAPEDGVDASAALCLTQATGAQKWDAYSPTGLTGEIQNIQLAARAGGFAIFAWALDKKYRDTQQQRELPDWTETQQWKAWALLCTNSQTAYNSADTTNIGFYCGPDAMNYKSSSVIYHDNVQQYPEIAFACQTLAVNYGLRDSVITACFKDASGISPCELDVTKHDILKHRRINMFVRVGNAARTYRYAMQGAASWWTDSYAGACNYREELQVAVCNCLYRNKKIPYTERGIALIVSAIGEICERYVYNGYLADRDITDLTVQSGYRTLKAYDIQPTPIYKATDTERAERTAPPISVIIYEAGAIHHVDIAVELVN